MVFHGESVGKNKRNLLIIDMWEGERQRWGTMEFGRFSL